VWTSARLAPVVRGCPPCYPLGSRAEPSLCKERRPFPVSLLLMVSSREWSGLSSSSFFSNPVLPVDSSPRRFPTVNDVCDLLPRKVALLVP